MMKKPDGKFGTGVSLREMEHFTNSQTAFDSAYCHLLLKAAVEKLHCIQKAKTMAEVGDIIDQPEWIEE